MSLQLSRPILDPYKTIGCFIHGPLAISTTKPFAFAAASYSSFKVYSGELAIKMVSPSFNKQIRAIQTANQFTYTLVGNEVFKMRYHHIADSWKLPVTQTQKKHKNKSNPNRQSYKKANMLIFSQIIIVADGNHIFTINERNNNVKNLHQNIVTSEEGENWNAIEKMNLNMEIEGMVHPRTYLNKVLVYNANKILLVNPISKKILFQYTNFIQDNIVQNNSQITVIEPTPLVDIVAVGTDTGQIYILNIRKSIMVFKMKQKRTVTSLVFSQDAPYMASGDEQGNIILWELEDKKIIYRLENAISQSIDHLFFVPGIDLLVATSSFSNVIRQFRINRDDAKTLSLFRQRVGSNQAVQNIKVHSNKQITYITQSALYFTSLYSHCNNYSIPITTAFLDSSLPFHLMCTHFNVQVYKQRTLVCKTNIHEVAELGAISISQKYAIVVTKSRIVKISITSNKDNKRGSLITAECSLNSLNPSQIHLFNQQYIYLMCFDAIYVFEFSNLQMVTAINQGSNCYHLVSSPSQSMLAFQNRTDQAIEVWDAQKITCGRRFSLKNNCPIATQTTAICFTSQNRFVLSGHANNKLLIWSMMENILYKVLSLQTPLKTMGFTPDGGYFLSAFLHRKQINIWNNYIGKITTNQTNEEQLQFTTHLRWMQKDYRSVLNSVGMKSEEQYGYEFEAELDQLLDDIDDADDEQQVENYEFTQVNKWTPLVYYDEIKARNTIQGDDDDLKAASSIPFFLDFKNIDEEKQKLHKEIKKEMMEKKNKNQQKRDKILSQDLHQITLDENSNAFGFDQTWQMLCSLSIAQVDYQLRRFMLTPTNGPILVKMFTHIFSQTKLNNLQVNVILARFLDLLGGDLFSEEIKNCLQPLTNQISERLQRQDTYIQRTLAILDHQ